MSKRPIQDYPPIYNCRFHPTDWWHETGCPHREWTKEELQQALDLAHSVKEYQRHTAFHPEDALKAGDEEI